ncbi:hypothetical protein [Falsiroseomonas sp. HW251]|uniref:hypothetical protein n=1 Tax=Falsiroseomonas sp. HW251 TaxID=3390998 RepID=UPI003D31BA7A
MTFRPKVTLTVVATLLTTMAAFAAMQSVSGMPQQAAPYPDPIAIDWTIRPTVWGLP